MFAFFWGALCAFILKNFFPEAIVSRLHSYETTHLFATAFKIECIPASFGSRRKDCGGMARAPEDGPHLGQEEEAELWRKAGGKKNRYEYRRLKRMRLAELEELFRWNDSPAESDADGADAARGFDDAAPHFGAGEAVGDPRATHTLAADDASKRKTRKGRAHGEKKRSKRRRESGSGLSSGSETESEPDSDKKRNHETESEASTDRRKRSHHRRKRSHKRRRKQSKSGRKRKHSRHDKSSSSTHEDGYESQEDAGGSDGEAADDAINREVEAFRAFVREKKQIAAQKQSGPGNEAAAEQEPHAAAESANNAEAAALPRSGDDKQPEGGATGTEHPVDEEEEEQGPEPPAHLQAGAAGPSSYGKALRPGEGSAMAAYVQAGKRIPRRGEVGLSADQIEHFESVGYVMSGSRHSKMNAVRQRKENQVYSAEEKAALAMLNYEEKQQKEQKVMNDLRSLVSSQLGENPDFVSEEQQQQEQQQQNQPSQKSQH